MSDNIQNPKETFATRFKDLLDNNFDSQEDFCNQFKEYLEKIHKAEEVSISTGSISQYANGNTRPNYITFKYIADFLGVSYDYLLCETDAQKRENIDIANELGLSEGVIEMLKFLNKDNHIIETDPLIISDTLLLTEFIDLFLSGFNIPDRDNPEESNYISFTETLEILTGYITLRRSEELYSDIIKEQTMKLPRYKEDDRKELMGSIFSGSVMFDTLSSERSFKENMRKYVDYFIEEAYRRFKEKVPIESLQSEIKSKIYHNTWEADILTEVMGNLNKEGIADAE